MTARNTYLDGDADFAKSKDYDICQLKYDGWWTKAVVSGDTVRYYSDTDREFAQSSSQGMVSGTFIGEFMRGTQWSQHPSRKGLFFVYDLWTVMDEPITTETYAERYRLLRRLKLPSSYSLVDCFPVRDFDAVWNRYVLGEGYEGVVFRRSSSTLEDAIVRHKREYTLDGTVISFEPGLGKYEGRLGAIRVATGSSTTSIGGGFTDAEREYIWSNQSAFLGRVLEFTCNAIFESGNVRHPRFVRWREDR